LKPSKYQQRIYDWVVAGSGNAIIQAVAGSGKTTTIIEATKLIPTNKSSIFVAFNKAIATELSERLPKHIQSRTLHSLGLSMFYNNTNTRPDLKFDKLQTIIEQVLQDNNVDVDNYNVFIPFLKKIIPLIKATLTNHKSFEELDILTSRFNIDMEADDFLMTLIDDTINKCKKIVEIIDFDDMIWIPIINNFKCKTYDYVFVDESQDLNQVQFELIKKICNGNTRIIAVGDRQQSIYAFRGADTLSMDKFKDYFKAQEFPLSICYRCPKKVVELAQDIVPGIEAFENNGDGVVDNITFDNAIMKGQDGDLVLCRTNAPLVPMAFGFIRAGKKAIIRGRDIGKNLIKIVDKYTVTNLNDLIEKIIKFKDLQEEKIMLIEQGKYDKRKKYSLVANIDSCDTIMFIAEEVDTVQNLKYKIEEIFTDEKVGIVCSSVHKAKGLEANTVFILNYDMMPHPMAKTEQEIEQEMNIKYVAITRPKNELFIITDGVEEK